MSELLVCDLGTVAYRDGLELQEAARAARRAGAIDDLLLLLEHPPVFTRGRRSEPGELPLGEHWYAQRGVEIVDVRRGGKVTYHGPGQQIGYPIVAVGDVVAFVRLVERAAVAALAEHGVRARGRADEGRDFTGVWVGDPGSERKIASIGLHVSGQVTAHGVAVNVDCDLEPFSWIVPCGLPDARITSIRGEGGDADLPRFGRNLAAAFAAEMDATATAIEPGRLESALAPFASDTAAAGSR